MQVPNRHHNSGKDAKRKLKPQAMRARKAALKALKKKLQAGSHRPSFCVFTIN